MHLHKFYRELLNLNILEAKINSINVFNFLSVPNLYQSEYTKFIENPDKFLYDT